MDWKKLVESRFPTASKEAVDQIISILEEGGPAALFEAKEEEILSASAERVAEEGLRLHPHPCGWDCCGVDVSLTEFLGKTR